LLLFLDPGSGMGKNQDPGSGINIPDLQHCFHICKQNFFTFNKIFENVSFFEHTGVQ
jgi:hypothetical protein